MSSNMYIRFSDPAVAGTSPDPGHADEIEMLSWSHGFVQPGDPMRGQGTAQQASHQNLSFSKYIDAASTALMNHCWSGKQFATVMVRCYRAVEGEAPALYLTIELKHVVIANYSISAGPGAVPIENIALDYGIVTYSYMPQHAQRVAAKAAQSASHDLIARLVG